MDPSPTTPLTMDLIRAARRGDRGAVDQLFTRAYDELRRRARVIRQRGASETLSTTALVHEAYLKLRPDQELAVEDRAHFTHIVARAMRQVVVDAARQKGARKRGGGLPAVTLEESVAPAPMRADQLLQLEEALQELERLDPRASKVVDCRFFGGLTVEETARALGVSAPTVKRDWRAARAWLTQAIEPPSR